MSRNPRAKDPIFSTFYFGQIYQTSGCNISKTAAECLRDKESRATVPLNSCRNKLLQEEPKGGKAQKRSTRAVHAPLQLRKLRNGRSEAHPLPLPLPFTFLLHPY